MPNDSDDEIEMFGKSDSDSNGEGANPIAKKRQKTGNETLDSSTKERKRLQTKAEAKAAMKSDDDDDGGGKDDDGTSNDNDNNPEKERMLTLAKTKLSKWAARLFDPNRPRGLVEAPTIIPLNDEFITAFGQREKQFDVDTGRTVDIDRNNLDREEEENETKDNKDEGIEDDSKSTDKKKKKKLSKQEIENCKVKVFNLSYQTTSQTLMKACERHGALADVNLILDKVSGTSAGRAYVTFDTPGGAEACITAMNDKNLDGRALRVSLAADKPTKGRNSMGGGGGGPSGPARYWEKDLSTKCFRCGLVGHMASSCTNEEKAKPCALCAKVGDHDSWQCPYKSTCFNCGVPGHINRECPQRRGMTPRRVVCGRCFRSGHHRWQCQERRSSISEYEARCMVSGCGKQGHFCCKQMGWFFGLKGRYCFNCGSKGHHGGMECERPNLDACSRDAELGCKEIERAEAMSLQDEVLDQRRNGGERGRQRSGGGGDGRGGERSRAKSQPPPRSEVGASRGGGGGGGGGGSRRKSGGGDSSSSRGYRDSGRRGSGGSGNDGRRDSGGGGGRFRQQKRGYR